MNKLIIWFLVIVNSGSLFAQEKFTISGFVYDKQSGEFLIGATVFEKQSGTGAVTNEYGFYSLTIPVQEKLEIQVSFTGYKPLNPVFLKPFQNRQDFYLSPGILLDDVTVTAERENTIIKRNETGVTRLTMKEVKLLPNLFGEVDIIKAFQLTPGVQSGGEAKSHLYVRGGSPDQNLILLDDVPLYYVAHFGGFFSIFNADAISDVKLIKGGFPARYGSRLSSVLDVRMKEGNMQKFSVQGTVGLLSSKVSVETPIIKNKLSSIVSVRKNIIPVFKMFGAGMGYNFYDINAKINYRISSKDRVFLSYYSGNDKLSSKQKEEISDKITSLKWGNTMVSFRWNHIYNNKLFSNLTLSNTDYRYRNLFQYNLNVGDTVKSLKNTVLTGINDFSLKMDFSFVLNPNVVFRFGANSIYHSFTPNNEHFTQSGTTVQSINEHYTYKMNALENAVYFQNEIKLNRFNTNLGLRYSSYHTGNTQYFSFEPRLLVNYILRDDFSVKYSFSKMNQFIHLLAFSGTGIPSDYWMPSNKNVNPENSVQNSFGIAKTFLDGLYEFSVESYYKTMDNLIAFKPGTSLIGNLDAWENIVEKKGSGQNYGLELFLQKLRGNTTGWVGVTVSKSERKFENINDGKPYPFKYDRLLDISLVVNHQVKKNIQLSAVWNYGTGYPVTLASEHYTIEEEDIFVYTKKNAFRMRDYHRFDIAAHFPKETDWGERTWSISIFNLYNRQNPYYYYYDRKYQGSVADSSAGGYRFIPVYDNLKLYQRSLFSIFPSVSYSFKF
jgi:outer membrane cobalamin receptor